MNKSRRSSPLKYAMGSMLIFGIANISLSTQAASHVNEGSAIIRYDTIHHPVIGQNGMVSSQRMLASQIGANILRQGGNAVDAAVATGIALAVTLPRAGNLGGGGFMLVHLAKQSKAKRLRSITAKWPLKKPIVICSWMKMEM